MIVFLSKKLQIVSTELKATELLLLNVDLDLAPAISQWQVSVFLMSAFLDVAEVRIRMLLHLPLVQQTAVQQIICSKRDIFVWKRGLGWLV